VRISLKRRFEILQAVEQINQVPRKIIWDSVREQPSRRPGMTAVNVISRR
jgi:hypothetical protein